MINTDIDVTTHVSKKVFVAWITAVVVGITATAGTFMVFAFNSWADSQATVVAKSAIEDHKKMEAHVPPDNTIVVAIAKGTSERKALDAKIDAVNDNLDTKVEGLEKQLDRIYDAIKMGQ